ncbi:MAG: hypothetical protein ACHP7O_09505 [Burkholderiales bacterium]
MTWIKSLMRQNAFAMSGGCLLLVMTAACVSVSVTHNEIFERDMMRRLGQNLDNVAVPQQLTHVGKLPNGNDEYQYHFFRTCDVIYEVSPKNIVLSWKYAGDSKDCYINP